MLERGKVGSDRAGRTLSARSSFQARRRRIPCECVAYSRGLGCPSSWWCEGDFPTVIQATAILGLTVRYADFTGVMVQNALCMSLRRFAAYTAKWITSLPTGAIGVARIPKAAPAVGLSTSTVRKLPLSRRIRSFGHGPIAAIILRHLILFFEPIHQKLNFKATCWSRGR